MKPYVRSQIQFYLNFLAALKHLHRVNGNSSLDLNWMDPIWYNSGLNINYRKRKRESKSMCWISDVCDSSWNVVTRDQLQAKFQKRYKIVAS